jgi:Fur family ferric uptake transcriptional regulator
MSETMSRAVGRVAEGQGRESDMPPNTVESIVARLRAGGARMTATRRVTIEVLLAGAEHRHLTAEDIIAGVRTCLPDAAESTIYRTLAALEDLGVVNHVHLGHGPSLFHLADQTHRHLVCRCCQDTIQVPSQEFRQLSARLDREYGFSIADEHFALIGECRHCRAQPR